MKPEQMSLKEAAEIVAYGWYDGNFSDVQARFDELATAPAILSLITKVEALTVPQGYKLVPVDPTPEMYDAAGASLYGYSRANAIEWAKEDKFESQADAGCDAYRDMLDSAPTIPAIPGTKEGA